VAGSGTEVSRKGKTARRLAEVNKTCGKGTTLALMGDCVKYILPVENSALAMRTTKKPPALDGLSHSDHKLSDLEPQPA